MPVYVYNNPKFQGYPMSLNTIKKLKDLGVHGVKDATFDIMIHANYHRVLGQRALMLYLERRQCGFPHVSLGQRHLFRVLQMHFRKLM